MRTLLLPLPRMEEVEDALREYFSNFNPEQIENSDMSLDEYLQDSNKLKLNRTEVEVIAAE